MTAEALDARTEDRTVSADQFRSVFRRHPAGVAVITAAAPEPVGFTATSVISVSAEPPLLVFSIDSASSSWSSLQRVDTLVVNLLTADQVDLSARFATRGIDRFAAGGWSRLPTGEPVLDGSAGWFRGRVLDRTPVGRSHLVSVLVLDAAEASAPAAPLVYHDRRYHAVGEHSAL
jgi:flavin reductase (DIM6/NTAB) family NADH-FMN oxidoreductase RutF